MGPQLLEEVDVDPWLCTACGNEYTASAQPPAFCPICRDERQFLGPQGQHWTTMEKLLWQRYAVEWRDLEPGLIGLAIEPRFAITQRALFITRPDGGVLYDCVPLIDDGTAAKVKEAGGLRAIVVSHPHFYGAMVAWGERLGGVPVYVHEADREWVGRPSPLVKYWSGETLELAPGITAIHLAGHFDGATVLHWADGAGGRGALFVADIVTMVEDINWVTFLRSGPNGIPLPAREVRRMMGALEPFAYDRLYGAQGPRVMKTDAKANVRRSADRYLTWIDAEPLAR
jgi:glyoxylase-like metal-dependent hydrolase (beta-lactamase superfamily II)